jgi:putative alpha-1,2-mannosidase
VDGGTPARRTVLATALYHALIKPCFGDDESPFWPASGPFAFDVCTMWDIYKTQIPLMLAITPDRAADLLESLIRVCEEEGNFPVGYRMARGADRFFRQASALAHTALADAHAAGIGDLDWSWALVHMEADLRRLYGEDFFEHGVAYPITHTLDLAYAHQCTAQIARALGDKRLAADLEARSSLWVNAFDPATGLGVLRGREVELLVPAAARHAGAHRHDRWRRRVRRRARRLLRVRCGRRDPARPAPLARGDGRGLRPQPVRGTEQRTGHGSAVGLPLRRPPRPDG